VANSLSYFRFDEYLTVEGKTWRHRIFYLDKRIWLFQRAVGSETGEKIQLCCMTDIQKDFPKPGRKIVRNRLKGLNKQTITYLHF
jgi:hypothetical protein